MFEVTVSAWFAAAHRLRLPDGSYEPLHGHNWRVAVTCAGPELDAMGVLIDFTRLKPELDGLLRELHDRCLNELPAFRERNPSAENVALHLAERLASRMPKGAAVRSVEVEEAPGCMARYFPPGD